ncbi:MAG: ABC transporter ATP-binding protein [Deltaproteobacteria bacterium]|nr:ABC transporter ATP-binding protein [Deltaproteobacteria bacterium]
MNLELKLKKTLGSFDIDVELSLNEELLVLFGPSGAGKTIILKMISGITRPDEGEINVGTDKVFDSALNIDLPIRDRRIGYLFQEYALFPHMTVHENIAYGISHLKPGEIKRKVNELLGVMRLGGLEERFPHELSGGQKQRCALARTLAAEPRVLLLDEPFSALDYQVREKLRADLINIHRMYPITTILVTHDLEEAFMLGKRIAVINNGKVEQVGDREDVFYRPNTRNVARFLGVRNIFAGAIAGFGDGQAVITNPDLGAIKANAPYGNPLSIGQEVSFCIRPEEILIIRPDRVLDNKIQDNIIEGEVVSATGKGSTQIIFLKVGKSDTLLKIELPNFVVRKLELAIGKRIRVSLKKENIWVIT